MSRKNHAFELITRGSEISAEEAKQFGLINHVFTDENFEAEVSAYARGFEKNEQVSSRADKGSAISD